MPELPAAAAAQLAAQLAELGEEFQRSLPARVGQIEAAVKALGASWTDCADVAGREGWEAALRELSAAAHRLAGAAGTFGSPRARRNGPPDGGAGAPAAGRAGSTSGGQCQCQGDLRSPSGDAEGGGGRGALADQHDSGRRKRGRFGGCSGATAGACAGRRRRRMSASALLAKRLGRNRLELGGALPGDRA
jgi:hypothetical protein